MMTKDGNTGRYRVRGIDCASDAAQVEKAARSVAGVEDVHVSLASQVMTLRAADLDHRSAEIASVLARSGFQLERLDPNAEAMEQDDVPTHITPAYRRALLIVVVLNVGYGIVEMAGGFLAGSQAVKADALDFLGDGAITFLGLLAVRWSLRWRARAAFIQGLFLGGLGLGVLGTTAYRFLADHQPEPQLMGILGLVALAVNVAAAAVLIPHRSGDANVRAVWLFSRNDAIGNFAVVVAALLVAWSDSPWPDLVVAVIIAALFLQSAWRILIDARRDLQREDSADAGL